MTDLMHHHRFKVHLILFTHLLTRQHPFLFSVQIYSPNMNSIVPICKPYVSAFSIQGHERYVDVSTIIRRRLRRLRETQRRDIRPLVEGISEQRLDNIIDFVLRVKTVCKFFHTGFPPRLKQSRGARLARVHGGLAVNDVGYTTPRLCYDIVHVLIKLPSDIKIEIPLELLDGGLENLRELVVEI